VHTALLYIFNDNSIEFVKQHRYLGIIFDDKLSWNAHIKHNIARAKENIIKLNAVARKNFGLPEYSHKFLYERAIIPMITYGCIVWGLALERKYNQKICGSLNRLAALGMTNCLRTTSTEALLIIAGLQPLEHRVLENVSGAVFKINGSP
jgi:hypothetical protein